MSAGFRSLGAFPLQAGAVTPTSRAMVAAGDATCTWQGIGGNFFTMLADATAVFMPFVQYPTESGGSRKFGFFILRNRDRDRTAWRTN